MKGSCHCKLDCATVVAYTYSEANGIHKNVLHVVPTRICTRSHESLACFLA